MIQGIINCLAIVSDYVTVSSASHVSYKWIITISLQHAQCSFIAIYGTASNLKPTVNFILFKNPIQAANSSIPLETIGIFSPHTKVTSLRHLQMAGYAYFTLLH